MTGRARPVGATVAICLVLAAACSGGDGSAAPTGDPEGDRPARYTFPGEGVFPEGIAVADDHFFVGSTADGTIYRGRLDRPQLEPFLDGGSDGRTTAVGLKVDPQGRLFVAGGDSGQVSVYDTGSGKGIRSYTTAGAPGTFVNDLVVTPAGVYVTDSSRPLLSLIRTTATGLGEIETFVDFSGTAFAYGEGFNANGIAATPDGRYLIIVASNTGALYRVDTQTRVVLPVDLGGMTVPNGDGLLLDGTTLYVVQNANQSIAVLTLEPDLTRGRVTATITDDALDYPTTLALDGDRLLVVNSQFDSRESGDADLPFSVVAVPAAQTGV